jgi:hypothetical protein
VRRGFSFEVGGRKRRVFRLPYVTALALGTGHWHWHWRNLNLVKGQRTLGGGKGRRFSRPLLSLFYPFLSFLLTKTTPSYPTNTQVSQQTHSRTHRQLRGPRPPIHHPVSLFSLPGLLASVNDLPLQGPPESRVQDRSHSQAPRCAALHCSALLQNMRK